MRRVGHKGADAIVPGNTPESFRAGVEAGADTIELDVLWTRDGRPALPAAERTPLVVAHDWGDAAARPTQTLDQTLDAFLEPPLDTVEIDLDIKLPGREEEIVEAVCDRGLLQRTMVSTMELSTLALLAELEPALRRGWTYPRSRRDWASRPWARLPLKATLAWMRQRLPGLAARELPRLGVGALWIYHPLASARLAGITRLAGVELIAWTVDQRPRMERLAELGVDGICTNDPRLLDGIGG